MRKYERGLETGWPASSEIWFTTYWLMTSRCWTLVSLSRFIVLCHCDGHEDQWPLGVVCACSKLIVINNIRIVRIKNELITTIYSVRHICFFSNWICHCIGDNLSFIKIINLHGPSWFHRWAACCKAELAHLYDRFKQTHFSLWTLMDS